MTPDNVPEHLSRLGQWVPLFVMSVRHLLSVVQTLYVSPYRRVGSRCDLVGVSVFLQFVTIFWFIGPTAIERRNSNGHNFTTERSLKLNPDSN